MAHHHHHHHHHHHPQRLTMSPRTLRAQKIRVAIRRVVTLLLALTLPLPPPLEMPNVWIKNTKSAKQSCPARPLLPQQTHVTTKGGIKAHRHTPNSTGVVVLLPVGIEEFHIDIIVRTTAWKWPFVLLRCAECILLMSTMQM